MKYYEQEKQRCIEQINDIASRLPSYFRPYLNSILVVKDGSFRTARAYAYDLLVFYRYLLSERQLAPEDITPKYLESLQPMELEAYLASLLSYETEEDRQYNEELRRMKRENPKNLALQNRPQKMHHMAASARARNLAAIRGLYKHLLKNNLIEKNPAMLVTTPKTPKKEVIAMNDAEVGRVFSNLVNTNISRTRKQFAERQQLRDIAIITLLLFTGIRVSECAGIDLHDINFEESSIVIYRKGGKSQTIYFNKQTREALLDYIHNERQTPEYDKDALLVSRRGERMSVDSIERVVKKYTGLATVKKISAHKLRSTYATALYNITGDAMKVKDALGHSTLSVVQKYVDQSKRNRSEAAKQIDYGDEIGDDISDSMVNQVNYNG